MLPGLYHDEGNAMRRVGLPCPREDPTQGFPERENLIRDRLRSRERDLP